MGSPLRSNGRGPSARPAPSRKPTALDVAELFLRFEEFGDVDEHLTSDDYEDMFTDVPYSQWDDFTDVPFECLFPPDLQPVPIASAWAWADSIRERSGKGVAR